MSLLSAFICYALTVLIAIALPILCAVLARKKGYKINVLQMFFGFILFIISFVCYFLILKHHLSTADGVTNYYNSPAYRVAIIAMFTLFFAVLLWIFGMLVYMRKQSYKSCLSFFAGFGSGGCLMIGGYGILMLLSLTIQCLSSSYQYYDTKVEAFYFSDETYVSVFQPMFGHVSFAIAAICFLTILIAFAWVMCRITSINIPFKVNFFTFVLLLISITAFLIVLCFMRMFSCPHYLMALISLFCAGISLLAVHFTYRFVSTNSGLYSKQFE